MRLIAYIRVSKQGDRSGDAFQSPEQQRQAIAHAVALNGAELVEEIVDIDQSGGTMDRPGLNRVMALLDAGDADGIAVARLDRFGRNLDVPIVIEGLGERGLTFISAADQFDTSTPMGRFALGMMSLIARLERDRHIETWAISTSNAIGRGIAMNVPYGYERGPDRKLLIKEPQASVVRKVFALRAAGVGIAQITRELDADGVAPARAVAWTRQTVRALLRVRTYLGEVHYGTASTRGAHPAIVSQAAWDAAQTPRVAAKRRGTAVVLSGLVRCAGCGYIMGASMTHGRRRYNCNRNQGGGRCPSPTSCLAEKLESHVIALFLERHATVLARAADTSPELIGLENEMEAARREFVAWRDDTQMRRMIGDEEYRGGLLARHTRLQAARDAHELAVRKGSAEALVVDAAVWADLTTAERRTLLAAGIDDVVLSRASGTHAPLAGRCVIRWVGEAPDHAVLRGRASVLTAIAGYPVSAGMASSHDPA